MPTGAARNPEQDEERQHEELRDCEWRLGLGGRGHDQGGQPAEQLHDEDERVEVGGEHHAGGVDAAPRPREVFDVLGDDDGRQDHERHDPHDV